MVQEIYNYAYGFTLEKGKKCLPQEVAIEMWKLLFSVQPWPLMESWYACNPGVLSLRIMTIMLMSSCSSL